MMPLRIVERPVVLDEVELRRLCGVDRDVLAAIENAFRWHAEKKAAMPPIMHIGVPEAGGEIDVKGAYVQGLDVMAVKIGSGFFDNPALGLPSSSSMMVAISTTTGLCQGVLLENGYLTNLRTGMAGAVAANLLAPQEVISVGILGAGAQARIQLECLRLVRPMEAVHIWSRSAAAAAAFAAEIRARWSLSVTVCAEPAEVVRTCQMLITTTPAVAPLVSAQWLRPGMHITAVGSDSPTKQELSFDCLARADLIVCDSTAQCAAVGELHHALTANALDRGQRIVELGQIVAGQEHYTRSESDLTICDLTGMGVQDTAIAWLAMRRHRERSRLQPALS